jgi:hypothetical protein
MLRLVCYGLFGIVVFAIGCAKGPATGTVLGEVNLDGHPVKDGRITFVPLDGKGPTAGAPVKDGKFVATDVPVGKMKIELNGNKVTGKFKAYDTPESPWIDQVSEIVPHKYNINSELTLEVKQGSQDVKYDLQSK